tara:strand:+ start:1160 stop:1693 length:534 start_codon:yes stop_codon:yes gene_type:complete
MLPTLVPLSGLVLLFTGFSALGFSFAAVHLNSDSATARNDAIVYYTFNGAGMLASFAGALPLLCCVNRHTVTCALWSSGTAALMYTIAIVFGVLENYAAYHNETTTPTAAPLYFMAWVTAVCSLVINGTLTAFSFIALYPTRHCAMKNTGTCPALDVAQNDAPASKMPRSRQDMRNV